MCPSISEPSVSHHNAWVAWVGRKHKVEVERESKSERERERETPWQKKESTIEAESQRFRALFLWRHAVKSTVQSVTQSTDLWRLNGMFTVALLYEGILLAGDQQRVCDHLKPLIGTVTTFVRPKCVKLCYQLHTVNRIHRISCPPNATETTCKVQYVNEQGCHWYHTHP